jgi:hypothetical protein
VFGTRKDVVVRVDDGILWIGKAAYPLRNIARAETVEVHWRKGHAVMRWLVHCVLIAALAAAAYVASDNVRLDGMSRGEMTPLVGYVALGLLGLRTLFLLRVLLAHKLWAMFLDTSGSSQAAVINPDRRKIDGLVNNVVAAIQNPKQKFEQHFTTFSFAGATIGAGANIGQSGGRNKVTI